MDNKQLRKRYLSLFLALIMILGTLPINIFAEGQETPKTGTRDAEGDIASGTIANDAPNAVHAFVGVQTGGDANLPLANATGQEFQPIQGIKAYFQWFEDGGYVSPVYSAISDANGRLNIDCKPYVASDGKIIKFDADPTVSGGHEKYRFWVDHSTIPAEYQLQYITGEQVVFPLGIATITQGGSGSDTPKNTHENWKILLMQKPKAEMHKKAEATQEEANGGYIKGKVSWDYNSPAGGVQWKYIAHQTTPAEGVTVKASYLSDYAMKKIYSNDMAVKLSLSGPSAIRDRKWTSKLEGQLQDEIKKQMKGEEDKWIAETVTAVTNSEGDYILQFNGTWGYKQNADVAKGYTEQAGKWGWTQPALDRLGTVAAKASDGSFKDAALNYNEKHINLDWLFVSTEGTEDLRVMTPYNNNWYTAMNSDWGIHNGWSGASVAKEFSVGVTNIANRSMKSDFVFGINKVNFNITNYDSRANTAIPGDVAETSTTGLPYSNTSDKYRIVWYDQDGNEVPNSSGPAQQPSSTGTIPSAPLDTSKLNITQTTEFTAKLYRVDSNGKNAELIAGDSFTVEVSHLFISRYDEVKLLNPKANDPEMKDANYSATGLPADLTIDSSNGTISGKAKKAGLDKVTFTTILSDKDAGEIKGTRERYIAVTDSPLAAGEVGKAYSQAVKPVPEKDPKDRNYIYKVKSVNFISGKEVAGLKVEGNATTGFKIAGTPTAEVKATEDVGAGLLGPNVEVTYDIYKTNDAGKEILVAENHVDKVPLVVTKAKDNSLYEPAYKPVDGKVGEAATVAAPTFTDADGKPATPENVTYALAEGYTGTAKIDANTGGITYTPVDADANNAVTIPVVVTYSDGSKDNVNAVINVTNSTTTADKVNELGGLNPQTIKVWKDDKFDWKDGVTPKNTKNEKAVWDLIEEAEVTDITVPERNSSKAGKFEGKLKFTFNDGSSIEVPNQMLIVSAHVVVIDPNNTDKDAPKEEDLPSDKIEVRFVASTGVKEIKTTGKTFVKPGTIFKANDFPQDKDITYKNGYKGPVTWSPDNEPITKKSKDYDKPRGFFKFTASATQIEYTDDEIIPYTPDEDEPTKGDDGKDIPDNYITVTFKSEDVNKGTVKVETKEGAEVKAKVKPGTNLAGKAEAVAKDGYGFTVWAPELGVAADGNEYTAKFIKDGSEVGKDDPIPTGWHKVTVKQDNTIQAGTVTEKTYAVAPKDEAKGQTGKLAADKFPSLTGKEAEGYENPAWYKDAETKATADPSAVEITGDTTFTAKATNIVPPVNKSATPTIDQPTVGDDKITGTGKPGATIVVKDGNGDEIGTTTVKPDGTWEVTVTPAEPLVSGETITATQTENGKSPSEPATETVKDKTTPTPQGPSVTYPDTDMDKGDTKTVIPEIKDKKGEPTRPDTTPIVVQPGNGVVVTPNPDGSITVTVPDDYDGPSTIVIPVVVTVDGEEIHTTLTIRVRDNKPVIDYYIPELKIHEYTPTYPVFASVDKKVVDKEVINSHDQYIFGYPDDTIRPDGDMTRAEAIAVVARLQKLDLSDKSSKIYKDTKADMWYNGAINAAFREGYLLEKEGENVRPNDKITRAELAELISHIDKKNNAIAPFDDVKGHKFEAAINQAYGNGRIEGYPDGTFKPDNFITRAEVATMLNKLYDRYPDKNFIDANQNLVHNYKDMSYKGHWGYYELVEAYHSHTYLRLKDNMEEWKVIIK